MENKVMCSICGEKEAKIVMMSHWSSGLIMPFVEGTCGHPECVKQYDAAMEVVVEMSEQRQDSDWEDFFNEQK